MYRVPEVNPDPVEVQYASSLMYGSREAICAPVPEKVLCVLSKMLISIQFPSNSVPATLFQVVFLKWNHL